MKVYRYNRILKIGSINPELQYQMLGTSFIDLELESFGLDHNSLPNDTVDRLKEAYDLSLGHPTIYDFLEELEERWPEGYFVEYLGDYIDRSVTATSEPIESNQEELFYVQDVKELCKLLLEDYTDFYEDLITEEINKTY